MLILLLMYTGCRLLFFIFNYTYFTNTSLKEFFSCLFYGLRFDLSAVAMTNSLFALLYLAPFPFRHYKIYRRIVNGIFYLINITAILLNCIDIAYFKFIFKRTTADTFHLITTGNDFVHLLPEFITDYWYIVLIWLVFTAILVYRNWKIDKQLVYDEHLKFNYKTACLSFIILYIITTIAYRGGFQLKPISIINAGEDVQAKHIPLTINTPFAVLKTLGAATISEMDYFPEQELKKNFEPVCHFSNKEFKPLNVVLMIVESLSKEYVGVLNGGKGYTPFLDSLLSKSLVFDNAFANGKKSMEGIPAILAGIPALMTEPYITSNYAGNKITGIAGLLKKKGYSTAFYHGGNNGTMGFDAFTRLAGFDQYYGRNEYNNDKDYDGSWGIWDEPFFQYFAKQLDQTKEPFVNAIFSLSSHHPYHVPDVYKDLLKEGELPIHKSVRYADLSLRNFFNTVSKTKWFDNTLFVITADHTGNAWEDAGSTMVSIYRIPVIFYKHNSELKGNSQTIIQQIDIMPSVLDYLGYNEPFFAFGKSAFDTAASHFATAYINEVYLDFDKNHILLFDGEKSIGLHDFEKDPLLKNNVVASDSSNRKLMEKELKSVIQTFNHSLIHNEMTAE